jgi:hypothetical protein
MARSSDSHGAAFDVGGFLRVWIGANVLVLAITGACAALLSVWLIRALTLDKPLATIDGVGMLVAMLVVLSAFALVATRLGRQLSTRITNEGISQWHVLSRRAIRWMDVRRVGYTGHGLQIEATSATVTIVPQCYRHPNKLIRLIDEHIPPSAVRPPANELVVDE